MLQYFGGVWLTSSALQVTVGRPPDATDSLESLIKEWALDDIDDVAHTNINQVLRQSENKQSIIAALQLFNMHCEAIH